MPCTEFSAKVNYDLKKIHLYQIQALIFWDKRNFFPCTTLDKDLQPNSIEEKAKIKRDISIVQNRRWITDMMILFKNFMCLSWLWLLGNNIFFYNKNGQDLLGCLNLYPVVSDFLILRLSCMII